MPAHCPLPAVPAAFPQPLLFFLSDINKNKQKPLFFSFKKQTRFLFSRSLLASVLAKAPAALSTTSGGYRCHRSLEKEHHTAPFAGFVYHPPTRCRLGIGQAQQQQLAACPTVQVAVEAIACV